MWVVRYHRRVRRRLILVLLALDRLVATLIARLAALHAGRRWRGRRVHPSDLASAIARGDDRGTILVVRLSRRRVLVLDLLRLGHYGRRGGRLGHDDHGGRRRRRLGRGRHRGRFVLGGHRRQRCRHLRRPRRRATLHAIDGARIGHQRAAAFGGNQRFAQVGAGGFRRGLQ